MTRYGLAGLILETAIELPELPERGGGGEVWTVDVLGDRPEETGELVNDSTIDGRVWLRIVRDGNRYVLVFPGYAVFVLVPCEKSISCFGEEGVGWSTVRHLLIDMVVPHVLAMDGSVVLHASAIATDGGALVFAGRSGCGKSSLAAAFADQGCTLLADDFVLLHEDDSKFSALPSYPGLRLWPDSAQVFARQGAALSPVYDSGEKKRMVSDSPGPASDPVPLAAIVLLSDEPGDGRDFSIEPVSARDGFMALFVDAFRMERSDQQHMLEEFDAVARLASAVRLLWLKYRRSYEVLPAVTGELLRVVNDDRPT